MKILGAFLTLKEYIMKIHFNKSIKQQIEEYISRYKSYPIKYIELDEHEYIQFLEEITPTERVLLTLPGRVYKDVSLKIRIE